MIYKYNFAYRELQTWENDRCMSSLPIEYYHDKYFKYENLSDFDVARKMAQKNGQSKLDFLHVTLSGREYVYQIMDVQSGTSEYLGIQRY